MQTKHDFVRPVTISIYKDRTLTYLRPGQKFDGDPPLPVFSVMTPLEAESLFVAVGKRTHDGKELVYRFFDGLDCRPCLEIDDLEKVTDKLREVYFRAINVEGRRERAGSV